MGKIRESYRKIGNGIDRFDIEFRQSLGDEAIFKAALELASDYLALMHGYVDKPGLQRTVEYYGKT